MDLQFTEEQKTLRDMVKTLCTDASTTDDVRKLENDPLGLPGQFWEQMKETGLLAMRLPEEHGGMGLTLLDCVVIFEELGRGLASGPIFESSVMAVTAISNAGTDAQKSLLESLGAGETIITPAWLRLEKRSFPVCRISAVNFICSKTPRTTCLMSEIAKQWLLKFVQCFKRRPGRRLRSALRG